MPGTLEVLNAGKGHLELRCDPDKPDEVAKAKQVIKEMLAKGFTILVEVDGEMRPVRRFRSDVGRYVIDLPPAEPKVPGRRGRPRRSELAMTETRAVGIGRTAGG